MNTELDEFVLRVLRAARDFPDLEPLGWLPSLLVNPENPAEFTAEASQRIQFWEREMDRGK